MKLSRYILFLLILLNINSFAQKEANVWLFGYHAGLNFNTNPPTVLTNGAMQQNEGCSSISSSAGQLLFYTDGVTVWDKNNNVMTNGTGLLGSVSSTNSGFIFPFPGNSNMYYIFTTDDDYGTNGLRYSTVDITMNGGLGQVIQKNVMLLSTSAEKLAAVKHANEHDIWLVAHEKHNNNFKSYLITDLGIGTAVNSAVGSTLNGSQGNLKISKCANKIAQADYTAKLVEVYDFNKLTGVISNPNSFYYSDYTYGVEFSPNEKYLYASVSYNMHQVHQIDLTTYTSSLILNYSTATPGSLQIAPNGKIYIGNYIYSTSSPYDYLGVINNPDLPGIACNIIENGLFLNTNGNTHSFMGLPTILASYPKVLDIGHDTSFCANGNIILNAGSGFLSYLWQDGSTDSVFSATSSGTYWCRVTSDCNNILSDTVNITIKPLPNVNLGPDRFVCSGNTITLHAGGGFDGYQWQNSSIDSTFLVTAGGIYSVTVTDQGCSGSDTVLVTEEDPPIVNLGPDISICAGSSVTFHAGAGYSSYHWQNGLTDSLYTTTTAGLYSVTVTNSCGSDADSVRIINIYPKPQPNLGNDTVMCTSSPIHLDAGSGYTSYQWQNSSTGQTYIATAPGIYSVTVTSIHNCLGSDTIIISPGQQPDVNLGENRDLCKVQSIVLDAGSGFNTYKWQDGSTAQTLTIKTAGTYSVTVTDDCGSASSSITISECPDCICDIPNAFTPNNDGENDILYVKGKGFTDLEFKIYNRLGEQVFISHELEYGWDGRWFGVIQKSDVYVYIITATCENGKKIFKKGNVTLLR